MEVNVKSLLQNPTQGTIWALLSIYDKSEISNVTDTYIKELVSQAKGKD